MAYQLFDLLIVIHNPDSRGELAMCHGKNVSENASVKEGVLKVCIVFRFVSRWKR